jgi:hypothetical protein
VKTFALFFTLQFLFYLTITVDYRAVALKKYTWVVLTNAVIPVLAYGLTRVTATHEPGLNSIIAVSLAGGLSAVLGIWLTRHWKDEA